jgi:hypothetical protein
LSQVDGDCARTSECSTRPPPKRLV